MHHPLLIAQFRAHGGPSRTRVHDHASLHDRADAGLHLPARCRRAGDLRLVALHDLGGSLHHAKHASLLAACLQRLGPYQRQMVRTRRGASPRLRGDHPPGGPHGTAGSFVGKAYTAYTRFM